MNKRASGLMAGAVAFGMVGAAALGGAGTANASCVSVGGFFSLGSGCTSTPLSFALVLGNGTANAQGLLTGAVAIGNATFADARGFLTGAIATGLTNTAPGPFPPQTDVRSAGALSLAYGGGTEMIVRTNGTLNFAVAQGGRYAAQAGGKPSDFGNVALGLGFGRAADPNEFAAVAAGNIAPNGPSTYFNLAVNLGDSGNVQTTGFANSVLNIFGNRNALATSGMFNNATNFFGDDNVLTARNVPDPTANILRQIGGNAAFNFFGSRNNFTAGSQIAPPSGGPLSIVGSLFANDQTVNQPGTGITIRTPFNATPSPANVLAAASTQRTAAGTQRTVVRPSLNFAPGLNGRSSVGSTTPGRPVLRSINQNSASPKKFGDELSASAKKFGDSVSTHRARTKADAADSGDSDTEK